MGIFSAIANLVMTDGSMLSLAGDSNTFYCFAIILIMAFLMARIGKKKFRSYRNVSRAEKALTNATVSDRLFPSHRIPAEKKCPNCAEHLPLSALICEACEYNFLSMTVGSKNKFLPSPEPSTQEAS